MNFFASFLLILLLVVISAFFSCAEISLAASRKIRLEMLVKEGDPNAQRVLTLQAQPGNFFTVVQIGLNAVAILGGVIGEPALTPHVADLVGLVYQGPWLVNISFSISFLLVTGFFILFADLMPKRLAMLAPERAAIALVGPMLFTEALLKPLILLFNGLTKMIFALFGLPQMRHDVITPNEIHAFVEAGALALLSIAILLWLVLRRLGDVLLTLIPLALAGVVTLELTVLVGLPLNFANIIALPLLLGVGVAFKIYYIMAWREGQTNLLQTSLTRAVIYSALTTATAFGSLIFSSHPGTSSMGKLLALSLVCTLAAAVLFQPILMGKPRTAPSE